MKIIEGLKKIKEMNIVGWAKDPISRFHEMTGACCIGTIGNSLTTEENLRNYLEELESILGGPNKNNINR